MGKSTILKELLARQEDIYFSVSATTRPPRPGEVDHVHYHFNSPDEFRRLIESEALLEWAEYVGNYYGTPAKYVDEALRQGKERDPGHRGPGREASGGEAPQRGAGFSSRRPPGRSWSAA